MNQPPPSKDEIQQALSRIVSSRTFENSDRLIEFLAYIVAESLSGREKSIRGKTIAEDVFGRDPTEPDSDNVVRVEARRLRRKLDEYYREEASDEPVRIVVATGGYVPRFQTIETSAPDIGHSPAEAPKWWTFVLWGGLAGTALTIAVVTLFAAPGLFVAPPTSEGPERVALREKSMTTLQAANLDLQGRDLLFPILDSNRQKLAISLFREAIELDDTYFGSYASAAHGYGTLALLSPPGAEREQFLDTATSMAERAIELAPQEAWVQAGNAWAHFARKDYDEAIRIAELSVGIDPLDGSVLDTYGMIMFTTGKFEKAVAATAPDREHNANGLRLARRNIFGVASFHLGNYRDALNALSEAVEQGDPVSAPTLVFTAAAHAQLGNRKEAKEAVRELQETYPEFRPQVVFSNFYRHQDYVNQVMDALIGAGWTQN